jgi:hypothetical protein
MWSFGQQDHMPILLGSYISNQCIPQLLIAVLRPGWLRTGMDLINDNKFRTLLDEDSPSLLGFYVIY